MKKFKLFLFTLLLFIPVIVNAESKYVDKVYDIVGEQEVLDKVTVYFFHQTGCPHCREENIFLDKLENEYANKIIVKRYEVSSSIKNSEYLKKVKERLGVNNNHIPFTIVGEDYHTGYSKTVASFIRDSIDRYLNSDENNNDDNIKDLPLIGKVDAKEVSIPLTAIILGTIDGFNPCAMWVLLFLINMLFNMKDRKKMWLLGFAFLFTSAFIYFLAMLGLSIVLGFTAIVWVRRLIALVAIIGGIVNLRSYFMTPKDGCNIVDQKKRKRYFTKINKFTNEKNMFFALIGVITLAASVNIVELACSAGFPAVFVSILDLNNVSMLYNVLYIMLYIFFYLIDDLVIFVIAMVSLRITGITTKYNKLAHLIGGIIMIIIGLLLIFKPEWIMLDF